MANDFQIFIGGQLLANWTDATLSRSKGEMTGTLNFSLFMSYIPGQPVLSNVICGSDVLVYAGGQLAFTGSVDRRSGTGNKSGKPGTKQDGIAPRGNTITGSSSIGPDEYTVKVTCRGKTKRLIDSSHTHPTTNILRPTTQDMVNTLVENTDVEVEWLAEPQKLDKVRLRDGATVAEELQRVSHENAHFMYETRDGKLRVTDDTGRTIGDPLILGENILSFSAEQSEDLQRSEVMVKGQRTATEAWGRDAVTNTFHTLADRTSTNKAGINVQLYADATPEALERRATFEANKRNSASKTVTIEVFGVQANGNPWDVGNVHYVEVPPEGIFTAMECTGLEYTVNAKETLRTRLTLTPVPSSGVSGGVSGGGFALGGLDDLLDIGAGRRAQFGGTDYPVSWGGPELSVADPLTSIFTLVVNATLSGLASADKEQAPKKLPEGFLGNTNG